MIHPAWIRLLAWFWRTWTGRAVLATMALGAAAALSLLPVVMLSREFDRLEQATIQRSAKRVDEGIQSELRTLGELCRDWAIWDDTYAFVVDRNPAYAKSNLDWTSMLDSTKVHLFYILDLDSRIIWGGFHPRRAETEIRLPEFTQERIGHLGLVSGPPDEPQSGVILTPDGPLLLVSYPIKTSRSEGPIRGRLVMGRLLDDYRLAALSRTLATPFDLRDTLRNPLPPDELAEWTRQGWTLRTRIQGEARLDILLALPDMFEKHRMIFTIPLERTIHKQGLRVGRLVFWSLFLSILAVSGVLLAAFLEHWRFARRHRALLEEEVATRTAELQESERRFRAFVDHTQDLMFWCQRREAEGPFVVEGINPAALRFSGLSLAEALGRRAHELLAPSLAEPLQRHVHTCAERAEPLVTEDTVDHQGVRRTFQTAFVPVPDETGRIQRIAVSSRDITSFREREETLLHAQKLESLGVLAGGLAHDFNNLLTAAQGNLDITTTLLSENPQEALPYLDSLRSALVKAANLTRQMLAYSGRGRFVLRIHDLNVAVQEMTALLEISISKKAVLSRELAPSLPPLEADVAQIQQVIMNLVTNASDALQDRTGTIRLRTWAQEMSTTDIAALPIQFMKPGLHVALEVSDTGIGMAPDIRARIFEPFFSTKGVGRGLGLSAMVGILRSHHGGLALESTPGQGTTFRLWFPASMEEVSPQDAEALPILEDTVPGGTILLVEDDPQIRLTTGRLLRDMGCAVLEACDGLEGIEAYFQHKKEVRLILLDLTMPRMDGREFLAELRTHAPRLPVIVTSGYTDLELPPGDPALSFLQKPYQATDLRKAFSRALRPEPVPD